MTTVSGFSEVIVTPSNAKSVLARKSAELLSTILCVHPTADKIIFVDGTLF